MTSSRWAYSPPTPCTCDALPQSFRLAAATLLTIAVLTLGAALLFAGHPTTEILQLFSGLAVVTTGIAWATTTGRRLPRPVWPVPTW